MKCFSKNKSKKLYTFLCLLPGLFFVNLFLFNSPVIMRSFTYSRFYKFLYRYGNIPVTLILFIYLFVFSASLQRGYFYYIFVVITAFLIYKLNRFYLYLYKILPFVIEAHEGELICKNFFLNKSKSITIKYDEIGRLAGGVFEKKMTGLMTIFDTTNNRQIGFFQHINNANMIETILLNKIPKDIFDAVSAKMGLTENAAHR